MAPNNPNTAQASERSSENAEAAGSSNNQVISKDMCSFCFEILYNHFHGKKHAPPKFTDQEFPLFVTWKIGTNKRLRGCTGTFSSMPLHRGLAKFALMSALKDSRFNPITQDELQDLSVSVSLLMNFQKARNYLDWTVGVHGVRIELSDESGNFFSATFLPEVASEQKWDHKQTIDELLHKSGYAGPINEDVYQSISLTRYISEKMSLSYNDWNAIRTTIVM